MRAFIIHILSAAALLLAVAPSAHAFDRGQAQTFATLPAGASGPEGMDVAVGTGIGLSIGFVLRQERLGDLRVLGIVDPNSAMRDNRIIPVDLSPAVSVFAVL